MPHVQVLKSRDGAWRIEPSHLAHADCSDLYFVGGLMLQRASMYHVVRYLLEHDVDPERDLIVD